MISGRTSVKKEDHSVHAFGLSGHFMMTSEETAIHSDDFNPRKIVALTLDDSLARLFECLTLEYSGNILLTPKWKNFRSQKLKFAEKTRINNAIWRSWHIQFQKGQQPLFCQFDNPLTEMAKPPKPVTLMVEGRYWKRRLEVVAAEYQKWRLFYKQMVEDKFQDAELQHQTEEILRLDQVISHQLRERDRERWKFAKLHVFQAAKLLSEHPYCNLELNVRKSVGYGVNRNFSENYRSLPNTTSPVSLVVSQALEMVDSCNLMESMVLSLPDTLFSCIEDDSKRIRRLTSGTFKDTADTVQPTLDTLQPSLEDMTPVLDELIEQLEASMKGSELNWDFSSLDRNVELPMGSVQSATGPEQLETMDHSGRYNEPYRPVGSLPSSGLMTSSWPMQTSGIPSQAVFVGSGVSQQDTIAPAWTSPSVLLPRVVGVQAIGNQMPGMFAQTNVARPMSIHGSSASVVGFRGLPVVSATPVTTSRQYVPASADLGALPVASVSPAITSRQYVPNSAVDRGGPSAASVPPITSSRQHTPTPAIAKRNMTMANLRYTSAASSLSAGIARNSSDSQLYALAAQDSATSRTRSQTTVPVEVQAPNLVAQLKLSNPRHSLVEEKPKRPRIPRNKSAPGLASLEASAQLKKAPQSGGVRAKKLGKIPRNRSDSSLASLVKQSEQSAAKQRRDSESSDLLITHSPPIVIPLTSQSFTSQDQQPQVYAKHQVFQSSAPVETRRPSVGRRRSGDAEAMQGDVVPSPSLLPTMATVSRGTDGNASSQLVTEMVSTLMNKGISMEEILTRLTAMAGATSVSVSQPQLASRQTTSLASGSANASQESAPATVTQHATFNEDQFSSYMPKTTTLSETSSSITRNSAPKAAVPRSRRKPQTPRPSLRSLRSEEATPTSEASGTQSTNEIIQNILSQNRAEFQAETRVTAADQSSVRESTTVGSVAGWGDPGTGQMVNHRQGSAEASSHSLVSHPVVVQTGPPGPVRIPAVFQSTSGEVMVQHGSAVDKKYHGHRSSPAANSGFTASMLISTPPPMTMTVAQASPPSRITETNKVEGSTFSVFGGNIKTDTETPLVVSKVLRFASQAVRAKPLTKTLPKDQYMEHRRMVHVSAEQKRRGNIKMGFDQLIAMVPDLASQGSTKISKAAVLRKSVDYILQVQREKENMKEERDRLKKEIDSLNVDISVCQQQLPETGVMVNRQDFNEVEMFLNHYIQQRTEQNPKFWIFSVIMRPLFDAYSSTVSTANAEEFCRTVLEWLNQNCSLPKLRPSVLASLRELIKQTSILSDPSKLPEQARLAASSLNQQAGTKGRPR